MLREKVEITLQTTSLQLQDSEKEFLYHSYINARQLTGWLKFILFAITIVHLISLSGKCLNTAPA